MNGVGDLCEDDWDSDGIMNADDNCPKISNPAQQDMDFDGIGDACDCDIDGDGVSNANEGCDLPEVIDNCPYKANPNQENLDGDKLGDACDPDIDNDGDINEKDCDPYNPSISHNELEKCNGIDDNCNGVTDEENSSGCVMYFVDADKDGFGGALGKCLCSPEGAFIAVKKGDCDDTDPQINPSIEESCNGKDDDCDGFIDEMGAKGCVDYYYDADLDDFGTNKKPPKCLCQPDVDLSYTATKGGDCNDSSPTIYPDAPEKCNLEDDDCDGYIDEEGSQGCKIFYKDEDKDGYGGEESKCLCQASGSYTSEKSGDCDDTKSSINPSQSELCNNIDDNCDGSIDETFLDLGQPCSVGKGECTAEGVYICTPNGKGTQCSVQPGQPLTEICDGKDNDCDGLIDEDFPDKGMPCDGDDSDLCKNGQFTCKGDGSGLECINENPKNIIEKCNGKDDDCDGLVDEEDAEGCVVFWFDNDGDGFGVEGDKKCLCSAFGKYTATTGGDCNDNDKLIYPQAIEVCNGKDDNCDGKQDEENAFGCKTWHYDGDQDGFGLTQKFKCLCEPSDKYVAAMSGDCNDDDPKVYPGAQETCDLIDEDCDGLVDEEDAKGCKTFYLDADEDGWGLSGQTKCLCAKTGQYTADKGGDCNDNDKTANPDAKESCNSKDDDCDGFIDEEDSLGCIQYFLDKDGDGFGVKGQKKCLCAPTGQYSALKEDDCNDDDKNVYPGASESCNAKDDNCNGLIDEENALGCKDFYLDADGDGFGSATKKCLCEASGQYTATKSGDCNDNDKTIFPQANELCNGKDDNCNNIIDEEGAGGCIAYYLDFDGDGFGLSTQSKCLCKPEGSYSTTKAGDCNDQDKNINPQANESCNQKDDNCNGVVDEEGAIGCQKFYYDNDSDTFGVNDNSKCLCQPTGKYSTGVAGDCNDNDGTVNPGATEKCNGKDDNCNNTIDEEGAIGCLLWYLDMDKDTWGVSGNHKCLCAASGNYTASQGNDCDDSNPSINPGAKEICNNGKDDNCNGVVDNEVGCQGCIEYFLDMDSDGWGVAGQSQCLGAPSGNYKATKAGDCNDADKDINPDAQEKCNTKDDNCNGNVDEEGAVDCKKYYFDNDLDLYGVTGNSKCLCNPSEKYTALLDGDCNDNDKTINPGATEACNGKDDNCNSVIDEENASGCVKYYFDGDGDTWGSATNKCLCSPSGKYNTTKTGDCNDGDATVYPGATETCNGKDDDCDNLVDEENATGCKQYYYDGDGDNYGLTNNFKCLCAPSGNYKTLQSGDCNDQDNTVNPGATEKCNGKDDNCNNLVDEENASGCIKYYYDGDGDTWGTTDNKCLCSPSGKYTATKTVDCNDADSTIYPGATEKCNGKDDDCDNLVDEEGAQGCINYYLDADNDGWGTASYKCLCGPSGQYTTTNTGDCNDANNKIYPGAPEVCNQLDDDCDGAIDEGLSCYCLNESFEVSTWSATGLWHKISSSQNIINIWASAPYNYVTLVGSKYVLKPYDGSWEYWYGKDADGSFINVAASGQGSGSGGTSTSAHEGFLTSPNISLIGYSKATLSFYAWFEIESVNPASYDIGSVEVSTNNGSSWTEIKRLNPPSDPPGGSAPIPWTPNGVNTAPTWAKYTVDLAAYANNNILIRFRFRTNDNLYNGFRGFGVDLVTITCGN